MANITGGQLLNTLPLNTSPSSGALFYIFDGNTAYQTNLLSLQKNISGSLQGGNVVFTTGSQNISGNKTFISNFIIKDNSGNFNALNFIPSVSFILKGSEGNNSIDSYSRVLYDYNNIPALTWTGPTNRILKNSLGDNSVDWENTQLFDSTPLLSEDWENRLLMDANGSFFSLDWGNRVLYDANNSKSLDWTQKVLSGLWTASGLQINGKSVITQGNLPVYITGTQNISGSKTFTGVNTYFADPAYGNVLIFEPGNRFIAMGTNTTGIDFYNRLAYNSSNISTLDWQNRLLLGANSSNSLNWNLRIGNDIINVPSINWNLRTLIDTGIKTSINWGTRQLVDSGSINSINWSGRILYDSSGVSSLDYNNRILSGNWTFPTSNLATSANLASTGSNLQNQINNITGGTLPIINSVYITGIQIISGIKIQQSGFQILDTPTSVTVFNYLANPQTFITKSFDGNTSIDFKNRQCKDNAGKLTIDYQTGRLYDVSPSIPIISWRGVQKLMLDSFTTTSIDWQNRLLYNNGGTKVLDYNNSYLLDNGSNIQSIDWTHRIAYDSSLGQSIDWNNRKTYDNLTLTSIDYQNRQLKIGSTILLDWNANILTGSSPDSSWTATGNFYVGYTGGFNFLQLLNPISGLLTPPVGTALCYILDSGANRQFRVSYKSSNGGGTFTGGFNLV